MTSSIHALHSPRLGNVTIISQAELNENPLHLPLFLNRISAGFPSPADDYLEGKLSLDSYLVSKPEATFFLRVQGDSMIGAGIHDGDMLIVDKSLQAQHNSIIIAEVRGELTVKRLYQQSGKIQLMAENTAYQPIVISEESQLVVWGVVTNVIHKLG